MTTALASAKPIALGRSSACRDSPSASTPAATASTPAHAAGARLSPTVAPGDNATTTDPTPPTRRGPRARLRDEGVRLFGAERTALQLQRPLAVIRQRVVVAGARRAQVALGIDVAADRAEHAFGEQPAQERDREVLVGVVDAAQR